MSIRLESEWTVHRRHATQLHLRDEVICGPVRKISARNITLFLINYLGVKLQVRLFLYFEFYYDRFVLLFI